MLSATSAPPWLFRSARFRQANPYILTAHINTSYRHFLLFVNEFQLIEKKELAPLSELNEGILAAMDQ